VGKLDAFAPSEDFDHCGCCPLGEIRARLFDEFVHFPVCLQFFEKAHFLQIVEFKVNILDFFWRKLFFIDCFEVIVVFQVSGSVVPQALVPPLVRLSPDALVLFFLFP
jgi:hypothetical protein